MTPRHPDHLLSLRLPHALAVLLRTRRRERPGVWARDVLAAAHGAAVTGDVARLRVLFGVAGGASAAEREAVRLRSTLYAITQAARHGTMDDVRQAINEHEEVP